MQSQNTAYFLSFCCWRRRKYWLVGDVRKPLVCSWLPSLVDATTGLWRVSDAGTGVLLAVFWSCQPPETALLHLQTLMTPKVMLTLLSESSKEAVSIGRRSAGWLQLSLMAREGEVDWPTTVCSGRARRCGHSQMWPSSWQPCGCRWCRSCSSWCCELPATI